MGNGENYGKVKNFGISGETVLEYEVVEPDKCNYFNEITF